MNKPNVPAPVDMCLVSKPSVQERMSDMKDRVMDTVYDPIEEKLTTTGKVMVGAAVTGVVGVGAWVVKKLFIG